MLTATATPSVNALGAPAMPEPGTVVCVWYWGHYCGFGRVVRSGGGRAVVVTFKKKSGQQIAREMLWRSAPLNVARGSRGFAFPTPKPMAVCEWCDEVVVGPLVESPNGTKLCTPCANAEVDA